MSNNFLKYLTLTGFFLVFFLSIQTCSRPVLSNKYLYNSDVIIYHHNKTNDTISNVVFFDYLTIDQNDNLIKKNGVIVSKNVKKFKYLNPTKKEL